MRVIGADDLARIFTFPKLIEALREAFRSDIVTPVRHHHKMDRPGEPAATLLKQLADHGSAEQQWRARSILGQGAEAANK